MSFEDVKIQRGFATGPSPLVPELLRQDSKPLEPALQAVGQYIPRPNRIAVSRYFDPAFAALEMEKVWRKCWQGVGREEDIPEIGDYFVYDVGTLSYLIVRDGPASFRALQNSCLHRGTRFASFHGSVRSIRCPFHAWEWNLDGSLHNIPSHWDFPQVNAGNCRLPEARIGSWGGYLFINPDPQAGPLSDALGVLREHFRPIDAENRFTTVFARKKMRANWKVVLEAFLESYHVIETHPDVMGFNGDASTQYDIWDDGKSHISRLITPSAVPSPHLGEAASARDAAAMAMQVFAQPFGDNLSVPEIRSDKSGRADVAAFRRATLGPALGHDFSQASDAYMIDSIQYSMFPNFFPWMGEGLPLSYQFMPYGTDPNESVIEIRLTAPIPDSGARPPAAEVIEVDFDTPITAVTGFGMLGGVFAQDFSNLPNVQKGLKARAVADTHVELGRYQECRIQHFHDVLDQKLGLAQAGSVEGSELDPLRGHDS